MRIDVYSREQAVDIGADVDTAVISISNPLEPAPLAQGWHALLRLEFDDITKKEHENLGRGYVLFSEEQAQQVVDFVRAHKTHNFLVHCNAGISRSVAVGAFILQWMDEHYPVAQGTREHQLVLNATDSTRNYNPHVLELLRRAANLWPYNTYK